MKKDYLEEGSMADTADLVVLGAYYGTGNKGRQKMIIHDPQFHPVHNLLFCIKIFTKKCAIPTFFKFKITYNVIVP